MTANASARKLKVYVGTDNQEWSGQVVSLKLSRAARSYGDPLYLTGTLELGWTWNPPESMNPRVNASRWKYGQLIKVDIANDSGTFVRHPYGWLYILKEPSAPSQTPDGGRLNLDVGCILSLRSFRKPDKDASGVTLGSDRDLTDVIDDLLREAGITTWSGTVPGTLSRTIPKEENSFVEQAARLAWAKGRRYIYQDNQGNIQACPTALDIDTALISFSVPGGEITYLPFKGFETPAEVVRCHSTKIDLVPTIGTTVIQPPPKRGPAAVVHPTLYGETILKTEKTVIDNNIGVFQTTYEKQEPQGLVLKTTDLNLIDTFQSFKKSVFESVSEGRRLTEEEKTKQCFATILSDFYFGLTDTNRNLVNLGWDATSLRDATRSYITYDYYPDTTLWKIEEETWQCKGAIAGADYLTLAEFNGGLPFTEDIADALVLVRTQVITTEYVRDRDRILKITTTQLATGQKFSNLQASSEDSAGYRQLIDQKCSLAPGDTEIEPSNSGQTTPPAAERRSPLYEQRESLLEGVARFQIGPVATPVNRERAQEVPYVDTQAELEAVAKEIGKELIGRRQAQTIAIPISNTLISNPQPLHEWRVTEPNGDVLIYQADAISYTHSEDECVATATGIWLGSIPSGGSLEVPYINFQQDTKDTNASIIRVVSSSIFSTAAQSWESGPSPIIRLWADSGSTWKEGNNDYTQKSIIRVVSSPAQSFGGPSDRTPPSWIRVFSDRSDYDPPQPIVTDPNFANVKYLLWGNGSNGSTSIVDSSLLANTVTRNGGITISTAQSKWTSSSIAFDGVDDYLQLPTTSDFIINGDFTWEAWFYLVDTQFGTIASLRSITGGYLQLYCYYAGVAYDDHTTGYLPGSTTSISLNAWHYVGVRRSGNNVQMYLDGNLELNTFISTADLNSGVVLNNVGKDNGSNYFKGYLQDVRLTIGVARDVSTVPTAQFPGL